MQVKPVQPYNVTDEGEVEVHLAPDAANEDWLRARRLQKAAEEGDEGAAEEFQKLNNDNMVVIVQRSEEQ